jgi:hypothetical protein
MEMGTPNVRHASQHWQHYCVRAVTREQLNADADKMGKEGWELVGIANVADQPTACFKRPQ